MKNLEKFQDSDNIKRSLELEQQDIGLEINTKNKKLKTSIKEPPKLELKKLPDHLEYAFLAEDSKVPSSFLLGC